MSLAAPVQAETPFADELATSFDQRSPHRLSVTLQVSTVRIKAPSSSGGKDQDIASSRSRPPFP